MKTIIIWLLIYFIGSLFKGLVNNRKTTPINTDSRTNKAGKPNTPPIISPSPISFPMSSSSEDPMETMMDFVFEEYEDFLYEENDVDEKHDRRGEKGEETFPLVHAREGFSKVKAQVSSQYRTDISEDKAVYEEEVDREYQGIEFTQSAILNGIIFSEVLGTPKARSIKK